MADNKLGFIFGQMKKSEKYTPTQKRMTKPYLPPRNPKEHKKYLLETLSAAEASLHSKASKKVDDAKGGLVAVKYAPGSEIKTTSLESKKDGIKFLYDIPEKHQILLDVSTEELKDLRKKISEYGEKTKISPLSKDKKPKPANNSLVAPIEKIEDVSFKLIWGLGLQNNADKLKKDSSDWFELSCRGGTHDEIGESDRSRRQLKAALAKLNIDAPDLPEFLAPERILFFLNCSLNQAKKIFDLTDCIFEIELVPPATLNWLFTQKVGITTANLPMGVPPDANAPSAVILDSGINSKHPLLQNVVALEDSVHPEDSSSVDVLGHGTQMSGIGIYGQELSEILAGRKPNQAAHWLESVRVFTHNSSVIHSAAGRPFWAKMTTEAINMSDKKGRQINQKAYCLAITAEQNFPGSATSWSLAVDQLAYNEGLGRIICVSIGNTRSFTKGFYDNFPAENHLQKLEDPSQASNVLSVGAYTRLTQMPPDPKYSGYKPLAPNGAVSPHTRSGQVAQFKLPIKPDVVFEGGNFAVDQFYIHDVEVPTLTANTSSHEIANPITATWGTSLATSLATKFVLDVWKSAPLLRPETIRGLVVHSASWTKEMIQSSNGNINDLVALCGYGTPSLEFATFCTNDRATVIVEDEIANLISKGKSQGTERQMKIFELPLPEKLLLDAQSKQVELRITLSYFAEPNSARGLATKGMDLAWDIQGPAEDEEQFKKRISDAMRNEGEDGPGTKSFNWDIGLVKRKRGTVQSDRWRGNAADLAGRRLVAVYPRYGWWNQRKSLQFNKTRFSLIISAITPDLEIYNYVKQSVEVPAGSATAASIVSVRKK